MSNQNPEKDARRATKQDEKDVRKTSKAEEKATRVKEDETEVVQTAAPVINPDGTVTPTPPVGGV